MSLPSHIQLHRSKRAKRLALRLDPVERVFKLVVPKGVSDRKAIAFAEGHENWMQDRLKALPPRIVFEDGSVISLMGERVRVKVHADTGPYTKIVLEDRVLHVRTNKDDPSARIVRFLKNFAKDELLLLSSQKAERIQKTVHNVSVRDTKSRWGSCSSDGNLSFSWRLIFAPPEAFDYVVAHEVAHLEHLDHSKAFWALCRDLSDNYVEGKYWMDNHGQELMRYG